ncbi:ABC-ATPase domain-containing protein [Brevibacterium litoralis]|uniref:ABC-ATPase domain-containing protein n=1 Tax=Brevibacterium litoralis TaxID=3138935 RepID=UPI0032EF45A2
MTSLDQILASVDGRGYSSYKRLRGTHHVGPFRLEVDHVQVDPYAPPSKMRIGLDARTAGLPGHLVDDAAGRIATSDFLVRCFSEAIARIGTSPRGDDGGRDGRGHRGGNHRGGNRGRGSSGPSRPAVTIGRPGQEVLDRTGVLITPHTVEARVEVALPAAGRSVRGREAAHLLTEVLPRIADAALRYDNLDARALADHVTLHRDQVDLQSRFAAAGLVAFVGDGSILPRAAGDSDLPLTTQGAGSSEQAAPERSEGATPWAGPESLRVSFDLPSGRTVTGTGIPVGVTVIVGGGYHGKSTLLRAIERGVYPHIGGDGREWVLTRPDAVSVRAEDGRAVTGVDISPFIGDLPSGTDTRRFSTTNASGSTSQAANLAEALDAGASALLIDEDTSATNFMIRDDRMRRLIPGDREPIIPFVDRIRPLARTRGVSTVLVAGGSGAFFDVADHVIALDAYRPADVTAEAHRIAAVGRNARGPENAGPAAEAPFPTTHGTRVVDPRSLHPRHKTKSARARGRGTVQYGREDIDLALVAGLVDPAQTEAIARILDRIAEEADGVRTVTELVDAVLARIDAHGLDGISPFGGHPGHMARPRRQEIHAALNRYRSLELV